MKTSELIVEGSSHSHILVGTEIESKKIDETTLDIHLNGNSIAVHGEHGTIGINSPHVIKYVQHEFNPITQMIQQVYD